MFKLLFFVFGTIQITSTFSAQSPSLPIQSKTPERVIQEVFAEMEQVERIETDDDMNKRPTSHYIFGYGSLICSLSRAITAPTIAKNPSYPAVVRHYQRTWTARTMKPPKAKSNDLPGHHSAVIEANDLKGATAMGVVRKQDAECSGVLLQVNESELAQFDIREAGYDRIRVELSDVSPAHGVEFDETFPGRGKDSDSDIAIWIYVQQNPLKASKSFPIVQSYLDVIMRGCLSISHDFAKLFLDTTHGWWHHHDELHQEDREHILKIGHNHHFTWLDDRNYPLYPRADKTYSDTFGHQLDCLLRDHHPEALEKRRALQTVLPAVEKYEDEFD